MLRRSAERISRAWAGSKRFDVPHEIVDIICMQRKVE